VIADQQLWQGYSQNGILCTDKTYSWQNHSQQYVSLVEKAVKEKNQEEGLDGDIAYGKKLSFVKYFLISDIDGTLVDGTKTTGLAELKQWIDNNDDDLGFGLASGRNLELVRKAIKEYDLPQPDILICSAGSEIFYTPDYEPDKGWESHISYLWKREEIKKLLVDFSKITLQENAAQREFKLSYYVDKDFTDEDLNAIYKLLSENKLRAKLLLTENRFLDILPFRASKGNAIRFLSNKWKTPVEKFITAGNSGNDIDMLKGRVKGIVVANHSPEMVSLRNLKNIYFAEKDLAEGVLEGVSFHENRL
jgi:sucrose-phosphate synthase